MEERLNGMKKYKRGLLIGRFQPFHKGHLYLLKESLEMAERLVVGIGTANRIDHDNPWTKKERRRMLEAVIKNEKIVGRIVKIVDVNDYLESDERWYQKAVSDIGPVDVVFGNNDWVNDIYETHGVPSIHIPYYKRYLMEGFKIRNLIRSGKKWQNRVPAYLVSALRLTI